jgi:hypothetical protein
MLELGKKDKKAARQIIDKGLHIEFVQGVQKIEEIIVQWQADKSDARKTYSELYKALTAHDKHIAIRYDYMPGSKYLAILLAQFLDGIISEEDLSILSEPIKQYIISVAKSRGRERE